MATSNPTIASVELHTRLGEAQSVLDNIVGQFPVGSTIADPIAVRVQLLLAGHHIDAAIWELARL